MPEISDAEIGDILREIGINSRRKAVIARNRLMDLADHARTLNTLTDAPTPSERVREYQKVGRWLRSLLAWFDATRDETDLSRAIEGTALRRILMFDLAGEVDPRRQLDAPLASARVREVVGDWLEATALLARVAEAAADEAGREKKAGRGGNRREKDPVAYEIAWNVLDLYWELTGKAPTLKRHALGGPAYGSAALFLSACFRLLGIHLNTNSAEVLIRRVRKDPSARWNRACGIENSKPHDG